ALALRCRRPRSRLGRRRTAHHGDRFRDWFADDRLDRGPGSASRPHDRAGRRLFLSAVCRQPVPGRHPRADPGGPALVTVRFRGPGRQLGYATLAAHFGISAAGRAQSAANLLLFAAAWALQWGISAVLDEFRGGDGTVDPAGYRWAFGSVLALQ